MWHNSKTSKALVIVVCLLVVGREESAPAKKALLSPLHVSILLHLSSSACGDDGTVL